MPAIHARGGIPKALAEPNPFDRSRNAIVSTPKRATSIHPQRKNRNLNFFAPLRAQ
jgi:hypothetical protein